MTKHEEIKVLPYPAKFIYDLVLDVDKYPEFLPWCLSTRILDSNSSMFHAEMVIGYRMFREKFISEVSSPQSLEIHVKYLDGPFKYLDNYWKIKPINECASEVDFYVDFEFKSKLLQSLIGKVFTEAVHHMVMSFEKRADWLYKNNK